MGHGTGVNISALFPLGFQGEVRDLKGGSFRSSGGLSWLERITLPWDIRNARFQLCLEKLTCATLCLAANKSCTVVWVGLSWFPKSISNVTWPWLSHKRLLTGIKLRRSKTDFFPLYYYRYSALSICRSPFSRSLGPKSITARARYHVRLYAVDRPRIRRDERRLRVRAMTLHMTDLQILLARKRFPEYAQVVAASVWPTEAPIPGCICSSNSPGNRRLADLPLWSQGHGEWRYSLRATKKMCICSRTIPHITDKQ